MSEAENVNWRDVHETLLRLDDRALMSVAGFSALEVVRTWQTSLPAHSAACVEHALEAVVSWMRGGDIRTTVKEDAAAAYAAVGASGVAASPARRSALATAHAAFALYFLGEGSHHKVFAATRDAISNALASTTELTLEATILARIAELSVAAQQAVAADGAGHAGEGHQRSASEVRGGVA